MVLTAGAWLFVVRKTNNATVVIVLDDFSGSHGRDTQSTLKYWAMSVQPVTRVGTNRKLEDYLKSLAKVVEIARENKWTRVIVNISLASNKEYPRERELINKLVENGVIVICASGNHNMFERQYPAAYEGVYAISACKKGKKASYSNYGDHIFTSVETPEIREFQMKRAYGADGYKLRERWIIREGTSISAPKVAGMLSYVWANNPQWSSKKVMQYIKECSVAMDCGHYKSGQMGAGCLSEILFLSKCKSVVGILKLLGAVIVVFMFVFVWRARDLTPCVISMMLFGVVLLLIYISLDIIFILRWGFLLVGFSAVPLFFLSIVFSLPLKGRTYTIALAREVVGSVEFEDKKTYIVEALTESGARIGRSDGSQDITIAIGRNGIEVSVRRILKFRKWLPTCKRAYQAVFEIRKHFF